MQPVVIQAVCPVTLIPSFSNLPVGNGGMLVEAIWFVCFSKNTFFLFLIENCLAASLDQAQGPPNIWFKFCIINKFKKACEECGYI